MHQRDRQRGALIGLACGDAVGTTVEFKSRGTFEPLVDMIGKGPFNLKAGEWTDDTSMALCLGASLIDRGIHDPKDQMDKYCQWHRHGYMSSNGECFDIGLTVLEALQAYQNSGEPYSGSTDPMRAGNGCIMRLAPVPIFFFPDQDKAILFSAESARTTHGASECIAASRLFGGMLYKTMLGENKNEVLFSSSYLTPEFDLSDRLRSIALGEYRDKSIDQVNGSGYVVASLEAALWCFYNTDNYRDAILLASNLGDDADTTAAVCGQIAGAFYGEDAIPTEWRNKLAKFSLISEMADKLIGE